MNCSCNGNWSCLSVSALYSQEDVEEQRRSQDRRLNEMLKCRGLEPGLPVPLARAAPVRLHWLILCWSWQKESGTKNAAGFSRGISKNYLAEASGMTGSALLWEENLFSYEVIGLIFPIRLMICTSEAWENSWNTEEKQRLSSHIALQSELRGLAVKPLCRCAFTKWGKETKAQQIAVVVWGVYVAHNVVGTAP